MGVRLLTELLDPAAYGELALGMTVATLVNQIVLGPLGNGVTRFYAPAVEGDDLGGYLSAVSKLVFWATGIIVLMILFAVGGLWIAGRGEWIVILSAAIIFAILSGYNSILSGIQNAARQRAVVALHQGMESWARFLVAAGLMVWLGATSTVAMLGYAIGAALVLASQSVYFRKIIQRAVNKSHKEKNWREQMWQFSWPFSVIGLFAWAQLASNRWALGMFTTMQEVGLYAVLFQLGYYPISTGTGLAMKFFSPILYQRSGDATDDVRNTNVHDLVWRISFYSLLLTLIAFFLSLILHEWVFRLLVSVKYRSISYLLPFSVLTGGLLGTSQIYSQKLFCDLKAKKIIFPGIVTPLISVALSISGAIMFGLKGVIGANLIYALLNFFWIRKLAKKY